MRSFSSEEIEIEQYLVEIDKSFKKGAKKAIANGIFGGLILFLVNTGILAVIYYGSTLVVKKELRVGDLTSFILYSIYITAGLSACSDLYSQFMIALGASERYVLVVLF
jgi:ABC-type multidrug transport system fused ATPase/permease subunit